MVADYGLKRVQLQPGISDSREEDEPVAECKWLCLHVKTFGECVRRQI